MLKDKLAWLALAVILSAGGYQVVTWQEIPKKRRHKKLCASLDYIVLELGQFHASDNDDLTEKEEQYSSGWQNYAVYEQEQREQALQQQLADENVVHQLVQDMFQRVSLKHKADVANRIKELHALAKKINNEAKHAEEEIQDMEEEWDLAMEAFQYYGFQQACDGTWFLPRHIER